MVARGVARRCMALKWVAIFVPWEQRNGRWILNTRTWYCGEWVSVEKFEYIIALSR